jgi:hypothetical protein
MEIWMEERQSIVNLLSTSFGVDLYPKADGRIEIPKHIIISAGWEQCDVVYMFSDMCGSLYISSCSSLLDNDISITVAVSHGRLRVPAGFLKKIGLFNKNLIATYDMNNTLCLRPDSSENALVDFVNNLSDDLATRLSQILLGTVKENNYIDSEEIIRIPTDQPKLPQPMLFLLEGDEERSLVFRPVNNPYKFKCCWVNRVPFLSTLGNDKAIILFAIPGIKRTKKDKDKNVSGFLIIDEITFGKIWYIIKQKGCDTAIDKDLIFIFSPKTRIGSFKVFINPDENLDPKTIGEAKQVCANPERFLSSYFDLYTSGQCDLPPTTITVNTIGNIIKKELK